MVAEKLSRVKVQVHPFRFGFNSPVAILAGDFANFANSNTHPLAKRHLV